MNNQQSANLNRRSSFSIVTPSFNQLDWLHLCVASVRDQVPAEIVDSSSSIVNSNQQSAIKNQQFPSGQSAISNQQSVISTLRVEHIIQDAGSPGIEDFAREVGADFYRDGILISHSPLDIPNYSLAIHSERDDGMYDAINRGLRRATGEVCAWLNCDEQYLPETLRKVADFFSQHPSMEIVVGDTILLNEGLETKAYRKSVAPDRQYLQAFQMNLHSCSLFFSRAILDRGHWLGTRFKSIGDAEWVAGLLDDGVDFSTLSIPLSTFILGSANLSMNQNSDAELRTWRSELRLSRPQKILIKWRNLIFRLLAGTYLPRRTGISIYTLNKTCKRTSFPNRWLDFRFRV